MRQFLVVFLLRLLLQAVLVGRLVHRYRRETPTISMCHRQHHRDACSACPFLLLPVLRYTLLDVLPKLHEFSSVGIKSSRGCAALLLARDGMLYWCGLSSFRKASCVHASCYIWAMFTHTALHLDPIHRLRAQPVGWHQIRVLRALHTLLTRHADCSIYGATP